MRRARIVMAMLLGLAACGGPEGTDGAGASEDQASLAGPSCAFPRTCGPTRYCAVPIGNCGRPPESSICFPKPTSCPVSTHDTPVCGCDGVTYASFCEAERSGGGRVAHVGACQAQP